MNNKSAFSVNQYDEIYRQIFDVIQAYYGNTQISILDTGCGTGTFGLKACEILNLSKLVLCDPSEKNDC